MLIYKNGFDSEVALAQWKKSDVQHKINILGLTAAYYLGFLNL